MRPAIFILLFSLLQPVLGETQRAEQLYISQGCAACHQINQPVDPNKVMVGPPLAAVGSKYANDPRGSGNDSEFLKDGSQGQVGAERDAAPVSPDQRERRTTRRMDSHAEEAGAARRGSQGRRAYTRVCFPQPLAFRKAGGHGGGSGGHACCLPRLLAEGASSRAIAVGLPEKLAGFPTPLMPRSAVCSTFGVVVSWTWRKPGLVTVVGMPSCWVTKIYQAPSHFPLRIGKPNECPEKPELVFKGYRMVEGQPEFLYQVDGQDVAHRIVCQAKRQRGDQ